MSVNFQYQLVAEKQSLIDVADSVGDLLGYSSSDFLSGAILLQDLIHKDDQDFVEALFSLHVNEKPQSHNIRIRKKDGKIKCVYASHSKSIEGSSDTIRVEIDLHDSIEIKEELIEQTILNNFYAMMESTDDYIYFKDRHHVFTGASQTLVSLTEPTEHWSDLIGLTDYDVFPEDLADKYYTLEKQVFCGEIKVAQEIQPILGNDGNKAWVDNRKYPIVDKDGNITGLFGIARDITGIKQAELDLIASQEHETSLGHILDKSLNELFIFNPKSLKFIHANLGALTNLGYTLEEIYQLTPVDIKPDMDESAFSELISPLKLGVVKQLKFETVHQRKDKSRYPVEIHLQLLPYHGEPAYIAIVLDITERKVAEQQTTLSSRLFSEAHEGIVISDNEGLIVDVNPTFCEITGYSREEVIGKNPNILSSGKQSPTFYADMWSGIKEQGYWQGEVWNRKKSGELYAEMLSISALKDDSGYTMHYVGMFSDITVSKEQKRKLQQLAHFDALTGLPNRVLLADRFQQAIAHSKRTGSLLAVCFLDLDNFKPVNDTYGHEAGDQLLVAVAERIKSVIREEDTVSRLGGDEFVLLLSDVDSFLHCEETLKRLHNALSEPYTLNNLTVTISASSGISLYPDDGQDLDSLLRQADQAMYLAKQGGRNRYHLFNIEKAHAIDELQHRLNEIQQALINNELELYYQPKVKMDTGEVFGAEALIRWLHPVRGIIPPLDFLPILDGTELEIQVGNWVVEQSLLQMDKWKQKGIEIEVSINISSNHILNPEFFSYLDKVLALYPGVDSKFVQLEILESSALGDLDAIRSVIVHCQNQLGIDVALDDFGTGYSSLTHLRSLPARTIKIDQSFVRDMLDDQEDYAIIEGVIGLATTFNRELIAEGVESTDHGILLLLMGCVEAQGYSIAKPMMAKDFPDWLQRYTPNQEWIECSNKKLTAKEVQIKLVKLTTQRWVDNIEKTVNDLNKATWVIEEHASCHAKGWLKSMRKLETFNGSWLDKLEQSHQVMLFVAKGIIDHYLSKQLGLAKKGLKDLNNSYDKFSKILDDPS